MNMIETTGAMLPGVATGAAIGMILKARRGSPTTATGLMIVIVGGVLWGALEHFELYGASAVLHGALLGWVVGSGGLRGLGGGGWWRRNGDGEPGPFGPDPEDHTADTAPRVDVVANATDPLWAEFEATPAFEPEPEKSNT